MGLQDKFDKYSGSSGGAEFFHLADDGDTALVRFLHINEQDLDKYGSKVVHEVDINGKTRKVVCLLDNCPLCEAGVKNRARLFLQLVEYDENGNMLDDGKVKVWERGKQILPDILDMLNRYAPIYRFTTEIVRHGEKGDTSTQYRLYPQLEDDNTLKEDTEEAREKIMEMREDIVGAEKANMIIERGKEDLQKMVEGTFRFEGDSSSSSGGTSAKKKKKSSSSNSPADFF